MKMNDTANLNANSGTEMPKKFKFKKRTPPPPIEIDDDDDFKPTPRRTQKLKSSSDINNQQKPKFMTNSVKAEETSNHSQVPRDPKDDPFITNEPNIVSVKQKPNARTNNEVEDGGVPYEEDDDDIAILASVATASSWSPVRNGESDKREAKANAEWKSLMNQMQKNEKATNSKFSKKGKPATKRSLLQTPTKEKVCGDTLMPSSPVVRSPLTKAPRLWTSSFENVNKGRTNTSDLKPSSSASKKPTTSSSTKIAPIFLPPSERKIIANQHKTSKELECDKIVSGFLLESIIESGSESQYMDFPENSEHFDGNRVILNLEEPIEEVGGAKANAKTKVCPFYKKLPGVPFCVDAFNYGVIPGMEVYFLSHFHADHYVGLTKKFSKTLICTHPTGNLVRMKLYVDEKCIRKLHLNKPYVICDAEVTLIDANHCPGSVMFVFRMKTGQVILHTGDFRFTPDMLKKPGVLSDINVDTIYLDTTYCSPQYDFPTQQEAVSNVIFQVKKHLEYRPKTLILCGSYLIGKERVYFTLAEAIRAKVFGPYDKRKIINALGIPKFTSLLVADENEANIHVVSMFTVNPKNLQEYLSQRTQYTNIIGIKPSGWQFSGSGSGCSVKSFYSGAVTVIGVPYSEHSSFSELKELVTSLKPLRVQPTVNVGNAKKRDDMMQHIRKWLSLSP